MFNLPLWPDEGKTSDPRSRICEHCGATFRVRCRTELRRYCGRDCFLAVHSRTDSQLQKPCRQCGKLFIDPHRRGKNQFCSRQCAAKDKNGRRPVACKHCGQVFQQTYRGKLYCSKECAVHRYADLRAERLRRGDRTCHSCGKPLHKGLIYCSYACKRAALRQPDEVYERQCEHCGKVFNVREDRAYHTKMRYCSEQCVRDGRSHTEARRERCLVCGVEFKTRNSTRRWCSPQCKPAYRALREQQRAEWRATTFAIAQCDHCGMTFERKKAGQVYCSRKCSAAVNGILGQASSRKPTDRFGYFTCPSCGQTLARKTSRQQYCSRLCVREAVQKSLTSGLEEKLLAVLDEWRVIYFPQYRIGQYIVDFYLPEQRLILEAMGCWWHGCAQCGYDDPVKRSKDEEREQWLRGQGYTLIEVWEHDVRVDAHQALINAFMFTQAQEAVR